MPRSHTSSLISSLLLGATLFGWMAAGETSNPRLTAHELPRELLLDCAPAACAAPNEFHANWVGRTPRGNLFVVSRPGCSASAVCSHWLVEKDGRATRALLELAGAFRFHRVAGRYPAIELDTRAHANAQRLRYEWNGSAYTRTLAQRIYDVGGVECGTRDECHASATRALKTDDIDRAQQIWQQVDGVAWI